MRVGEWVQRLTDRHQTYRTSGDSGAARNSSGEYFVIVITLVIRQTLNDTFEKKLNDFEKIIIICVLGAILTGS